MNNNFTLLYVEDDELIRENFTEIFKTYFKTVITTDDGNNALDIYNNNKIDVAILDISINGMNGLNLASKIREVDKDIIILITSAYSEKEKLLTAINLHLFAYLIKPIKHQELMSTLESILLELKNDELNYLHGDYTWNQNKQTLYFKNELLNLTKNEVKVIDILFQYRNRFMNACDLHAILFEEKESPDTTCNNVTQLLSRLKKKIVASCKTDEYFIENYYGSGYKIFLAKG